MRVYVDSIGCRLNQSEIESIATRFREQGHELVDRLEKADIVVINTCAVTGKAVADSRRLIRHAAKREDVRVIATGCWAELEPQEIARLSERIQVVSNQGKAKITEQFSVSGYQPSIAAARMPVPGDRFRTRAFIKVQDGCDNHCTFCITRIARGRAVSSPATEVLRDIEWAAAGGANEAVLTGVNLSSWGKDFTPALGLIDLVEMILDQTDIPRLRLSSLEPWNLDERFFNLWENPRICRHIHLPLQSGSDWILKRMGRLTDCKQFAGVVESARRIVPEMAISTDIIAGFPGEEERHFEESMQFVRDMRFESGHVFAYSPRPDTPAALLSGRVPPAEIKRRSGLLRSVFAEQGCDYQRGFIGSELDVLWESSVRGNNGEWQLKGLSDNYLRVVSGSSTDRWNQIDRVKIGGMEKDCLLGTVIEKIHSSW